MGYGLDCLDEPVFMAVPKPMLTEFGIHHRLESCVLFIGRPHAEILREGALFGWNIESSLYSKCRLTGKKLRFKYCPTSKALVFLGYILVGTGLLKIVRNGFEKPATYKDSPAQILGIHSPFIYLNGIVLSNHRWSVEWKEIMNIISKDHIN